MCTTGVAACSPGTGGLQNQLDHPPGPPGRYCETHLTGPIRVVLEEPCGMPVAVLTPGARTMLLTAGPPRRFDEATAKNGVATQDWVRLLPVAFSGTVDAAVETAVAAATSDDSLDVLGIAAQYIVNAPPILQDDLQIAGAAQYGPLDPVGLRAEGADFNDYLGITWRYGDGSVSNPQPDQFRSLDCSGYMRMVWGYRGGLPLLRGAATAAEGLPRRSVQMNASAFGVPILDTQLSPQEQLGALQAGDLLFFDADKLDGALVDHVGMFLGKDDGGHYRFISSRKVANGPTLGDAGAVSIVDGTGYYALAFRSARRL